MYYQCIDVWTQRKFLTSSHSNSNVWILLWIKSSVLVQRVYLHNYDITSSVNQWLEVFLRWQCGRLWLRGRASVLLSEGCWFDSPGLHEVLGQDTEPWTAPDMLVGTMHGSLCHQCMNYCKLLWTKASAKCTIISFIAIISWTIHGIEKEATVTGQTANKEVQTSLIWDGYNSKMLPPCCCIHNQIIM